MQAATERMEWLFNEFDNVIVCFSGGKDSTVTLNIALEVAERLGKLPLKVLFLDQEAEWATVIDYIREVMADPRVDPIWLQIPIKLFNATSANESWLYCWEAGEENNWMRAREPNAVTENIYGTDRFAGLFGAYLKYHYPDENAVMISGVRCEESPARLLGLTSSPTYKGETWGKIRDKVKHHYDMYPLYDWSYTDIWKAILDNKWSYCKLYDYQYKYGVKTQDMRVSNLHHETSIGSLYYLQEIEKETWNKLVNRLDGINTAGHLKDDAFRVNELPFMFSDWREYRDYLVDKLLTDPEHIRLFVKRFAKDDAEYEGMADKHLMKMYKVHITGLMANDYHMTKINNGLNGAAFMSFRRHKQGKRVPEQFLKGVLK